MTYLQTNKVILRNLRHDDIPRLAELANNKKISINLRDAFPNPYTNEDAENFIKMIEKQNPKTTFAIEYKDDKLCDEIRYAINKNESL